MQSAPDRTRELGFWGCTALVIGNIIGTGIFLLPVALAPYGLNAISAWGVTIVGCCFIAMVFAGLARRFPDDDGPFAYTQRAFGRGTAFIALWCYWVSCWLTNATLATGVVAYLSKLVPALSAMAWLPAASALAIVWLFVLINLRGIRAAAWVQMLTTVLKLLPLVGIVLLGLWQLVANPHAYVAHVPRNPPSLREVLAASTLALYALLGIECATIPAARVRDPGRTIPRATIAGTLITALLFLCVCAIPVLLLPQAQLAASSAPFADLFSRFVGTQSGRLVALAVVVSGLGCLNGWTLITGELTQTFAMHESFPRSLGRTNARGVPVYAFLLTGILPSLMLLMNYSDSLSAAFTFLSVMVTAATVPLYVVCAAAVLVLCSRSRALPQRPRELVWIGAAVLSIAYCIWIFFGMGAKPLLWAIVLGAAGFPVHWCSVYLRRRRLVAGTL